MVISVDKCVTLSRPRMDFKICVVPESGEVWTFGMNTEGQLGHSEGVKYVAVSIL